MEPVTPVTNDDGRHCGPLTDRARFWRLSPLSLLLLAIGIHSGAAASQDLFIEHVTVVSPERDQELRNADVTIRNGVIQSVSLARAAIGVTAKQSIDGTNLYLIPGLIDSHVHLSQIPGMTEEQERAHPDIARAARDQFPRSY